MENERCLYELEVAGMEHEPSSAVEGELLLDAFSHPVIIQWRPEIKVPNEEYHSLSLGK